jgi:integrase
LRSLGPTSRRSSSRTRHQYGARTENLDQSSRAELAAIDLHFHDLHREAGSRWLEGGVSLMTVRDWLGHTSIAQTSVYLAGTTQTAHDAMRRYEESLQPTAKGSRRGGQKGQRKAKPRLNKRNRTAVGRRATIM